MRTEIARKVGGEGFQDRRRFDKLGEDAEFERW